LAGEQSVIIDVLVINASFFGGLADSRCREPAPGGDDIFICTYHMTVVGNFDGNIGTSCDFCFIKYKSVKKLEEVITEMPIGNSMSLQMPLRC